MNSSTASFISVQAFGNTGPPVDPNAFTTFLVTIDLSSFSLELQGGQQYVLGVTNSFGNFITGTGATFRQMHSRATGFEDLFQADDTPLDKRPGFLNSQHFFGVDQLAGAVSIGNGNYDGDNDVDGADFLKWQRNFGQSVPASEDSNGDGIADGKDLAIWEATYGETWSTPLAAAATVPEPSTCGLVLAATLLLAMGRRRSR